MGGVPSRAEDPREELKDDIRRRKEVDSEGEGRREVLEERVRAQGGQRRRRAARAENEEGTTARRLLLARVAGHHIATAGACQGVWLASSIVRWVA